MDKLEIYSKDVDTAISIMKEVAAWGREKGFRVWRDSEWWPDAKEFEAAYHHKLCVLRKFAHQGMTKRVIDCIKEICLEKGVKYIRLDAGINEEAVKQIYLNVGFKIVKVIEERGMALYELEI